jgi:hypothetical protein
MNEMNESNRLGELLGFAKKTIGTAVTIIDPNGTLRYYNRRAAAILYRKLETIGIDVRSHHEKAASNEKLDLMLQEFKNGRVEPFCYKAKPYGEVIRVTLSPIVTEENFVGCVQSVVLK